MNGWNDGTNQLRHFHFTNTAGVYPFANYVFPNPAIISALAGLKVDAMLVLFNGADLVGVSNVDRLTLQ